MFGFCLEQIFGLESTLIPLKRHYYCHAYLGPPTGSCPSLFTPQFEAHVAAAVNPARPLALARRPSSSLVAVVAFIGESGHVGRNDNSLKTGGRGRRVRRKGGEGEREALSSYFQRAQVGLA